MTYETSAGLTLAPEADNVWGGHSAETGVSFFLVRPDGGETFYCEAWRDGKTGLRTLKGALSWIDDCVRCFQREEDRKETMAKPCECLGYEEDDTSEAGLAAAVTEIRESRVAAHNAKQKRDEYARFLKRAKDEHALAQEDYEKVEATAQKAAARLASAEVKMIGQVDKAQLLIGVQVKLASLRGADVLSVLRGLV